MQKQFPLTLFSTNLLSSRNVIQQKTDQFSVGMKLKERELSLKPKDKKKKKKKLTTSKQLINRRLFHQSTDPYMDFVHRNFNQWIQVVISVPYFNLQKKK